MIMHAPNALPAGTAARAGVIVLAVIFAGGLGTPARAQEASSVTALSETLKKVKDTGAITLGYRESSLPFSYLNRRRQPIGYSIDLCCEIVDSISAELDDMDVRILFAPVTPTDRLQKVASGAVDLECGSTTANTERRAQVAFSPIFFIAGIQLMVPKSSAVGSYRDLAGKTVVVTAGTTNEVALRTLSDKQRLGIAIISTPDHAQSLESAGRRKGRRICNRRCPSLWVYCDRANRRQHEGRRGISLL
jgi:glutamate/aspartate transport system substrate-binding protein